MSTRMHLPNDAMKAAALKHARSVSEVTAVHSISDRHLVRQQAVGTEACGIFFYPDRTLASATSPMPTVGKFIPLVNRHTTPDVAFTWDSSELVAEITRAYGTVPAGFLQLWHTHLRVAPPSEADWTAVDDLYAALSRTHLWGPAHHHYVLQMPTGVWTEYGTIEMITARRQRASRLLG